MRLNLRLGALKGRRVAMTPGPRPSGRSPARFLAGRIQTAIEQTVETAEALIAEEALTAPTGNEHPMLKGPRPSTPIPEAGSPEPEPKLEPSLEVLNTWRNAHAVCFDVDHTLCKTDGIDGLAAFKGKGPEVEALTNAAMDGTLSLEEALFERMRIIDPTPEDIQNFLATATAEDRLTPNALELVTCLRARGIDVFLISGGFREMIMPVAKYLGIPPENVYANRMFFTSDDDTGLPTKFAGFDLNEPTAHQGGKPTAIAQIRAQNPYDTIVMVGDGITDLEAVQVSGGADLFIGYGGVVPRKAVMQGADWYVTDHNQLIRGLKRYKVAFLGSGAWACAAAKMAARNVRHDDPADDFEDVVNMWVYEEDVDGRQLTEIINTEHENVKYFPGIKLGDNVRAIADVGEAVRDANVLVFVAPHQFLHGMCKQLKGKICPDAVAISLTKGMRVREDGPQLISQMVRKTLGIDCCVLMGANIATDIGKEQLSEATIGYSILENAQLFYKLFATPYFHLELIQDVAGTEMAGTLKNIVAVGAGMIEGLGYGPNTKAAIIRRGLLEMVMLAKELYPTVRDETFMSSCGVADLVASSYGGRNRLVAKAFVDNIRAGTPKSFDTLEAELLKGQKLQGVLTSNEVQAVLKKRGWEDRFPLFTTINRVIHGELPPEGLVIWHETEELAKLKRTGLF